VTALPPAELQIPPDTRFVGLARLTVCAAARAAGLDEGRTEDLRIAVSEATANAILAHQRQGMASPVCLQFGLGDAGAFEVTITDCGPGFEPMAPIDVEERDWTTEGGLGVTLIRGLTDEVEFVRGEGMHVNLRFSIILDGEQPPGAPGASF
jgi:anti-sigma regulatory factor (Ser/Thr protein kinase)